MCDSGGEANVLLDRGIDLFQKHKYADAEKYFQRIMQSYPQSKDIVARANFYNAECDRIRNKKSIPSTRVLKFKPETTHGQILSPGEKPPASTLEESQKQLLPGSTTAAPPAQ